MARQVLPIVGAIVGSFIPGVGTQIGFMIGSIVGNIVDPQIIKGPSIGEGQQTTSQDGQPRPIIWGLGCVGANIIAKGDLKKSTKEDDGKGGPVTVTEHFHLTYALRICEGPINGVLRIWEDEKLVYDVRTEGSQVKPEENVKFAKNFRLYLGGEDQMPDPELEVIFGAGNTPAYRGTAYIVFPNRDVTDRRGSVPNYRFEVITSPVVSTPVVSWISSNAHGTIDIPNLTAETTGNTGLPGVRGFSPDGRLLVLENQSVFRIKPDGSDYEDQGASGGGELYGDISSAFFSNTILVSTGSDPNPPYGHKLRSYRFSDEAYELTPFPLSLNDATEIPYPVDSLTFAPGNSTRLFMSSTSNDPIIAYYNPDNGLATGFAPVSGMRNRDAVVRWRNQNQVSFVRQDGVLTLLTVGAANVSTVYAELEVSGDVWHDWSANGDHLYLVENGVIRIFTVIIDSGNPLGHAFQEIEQEVTQPPKPALNSFMSMNREKTVMAVAQQAANASEPFAHFFRVAGRELTSFTEHPKGGNLYSGMGLLFNNLSGSSYASTDFSELDSIVLDIADRSRVSASVIDVSDIQDMPVMGLVAAGDYSGGNIIRSMQDVFFFDPSDYDKQLHFRRRGHPVIGSISLDDMVAESYDYERASAIEYPRKLELMYQNPRVGYAAAKATVRRNTPDEQVSGDVRMEVPVVMDETMAAQVADRQLKVAWADAEGQVTFSLPTEYDYLVPGDCIGVFLRQTQRRVRIEKIERADGQLNIEAKVDQQSAYTSDVTALPLPLPTPPPPTITGDTELAFLNIPALVDSHDYLLYYLAATGQAPAWYGAVIDRQVYDDAPVRVATIQRGAGMGYLLDDVQPASEHYADTTNKIRVRLYNNDRSPEALSQEQLLRERNAIALCREDGTAEVLQYRDCVNVGDNDWELSYLIRGRLNSGSTGHLAGAQLVMLEGVHVVAAGAPLMGAEMTHIAMSFGEEPEDAEQRTDTWQPPLSQVEFPVGWLDASLDSGILSASWIPRHRFGTDVFPVASVNFLGYHVTLSDGINTLEIETTETTLTQELAGWSSPIQVSVSAVNRYTGPGPAVTRTV